MTEPEDLEDDLFADLYEADESSSKPQTSTEIPIEPPAPSAPLAQPQTDGDQNDVKIEAPPEQAPEAFNHGQNDYAQNNGNNDMNWNGANGNNNQYGDGGEQESHAIGIKEDGKMFIGGLNWETTDQSLKEYFSKFGEVQECTVMRDGATGRSRGFGFLTFKDPRTVNVVMVKEHWLDGKIVRALISTSTKAPSRLSRPRPEPELTSSKIDPKRAIPRDEQERTSKIFVGGVSQDANETDFKEYFAQFGRVVDATLMMDKDTGRPRGFGFVTFDSEAAVDSALAGDQMILGKPIEIKKAQPRGNMREDEDTGFNSNRRGGHGRGGKNFQHNDRGGNYDNNNNNNGPNSNQGMNQQGGGGPGMAGMTPQMMAQYWTKMQQYFQTMQQQMAAMQSGQMGMGGMNPQMMQQMQQMQAMQQMKAMQMASGAAGRSQGSASPLPQSPGAQGMQGMTPQMMQQMQQMQQMQAGAGFGNPGMAASPMGNFGAQPQAQGGPPGRGTPGYNAQDQLAFEQQKYEQQQARRAQQEAQQMQYSQGAPTSWEGMYDDVPQPYVGNQGKRGGGAGGGGGGHQAGGNRGSQGPQSAPPANAPTGPKNAGKPGANYRGGGRGGHRGFHPYSRNG